MPGERRASPIPIQQSIIDKDGRPTTEFTRYLMDTVREGIEGRFGKVPVGAIIMFSGNINTLPSGWEFCNGNNGTPDLRDRFVLGIEASDNFDETGGYHKPQMPAHTHTITHTHTMAHTHESPRHNHTISHTHTINQHRHTIDHNHGPEETTENGEHTHTYINYPQYPNAWTSQDEEGWEINEVSGEVEETSEHTGHTHEVNISSYSGSSGYTDLSTGAPSFPNSGTNDQESTGGSSAANTGGSSAANTGSKSIGDQNFGNLPPYYKLAYIMRMF